ncbi:hypothetical protein Acr_08g0018240 [Actinidia rufa]|uniref:Uncharacterized protein n=1 Tax=Actinidia rufa TaxID=165716 RepID=A0A7J0F415_9ERIC|nr:hypothetical protein Acr_08g0018240 [Actinidia rufa]
MLIIVATLHDDHILDQNTFHVGNPKGAVFRFSPQRVLVQIHRPQEHRPRLFYKLSSSSAPSYLSDPSIELFPEDVDLPADAPRAAPPATVYPVESPSTDSVPPIAPPVPLPRELLVRRSTRVVFRSLACRGIYQRNG